VKFINCRVISFVLCGFILIQSSLSVKALDSGESYGQNQTSVTYTGNIESTNYGASSGSGESASATVELKYTLGSLIAIKLPNPGDSSLTFFDKSFQLQSSKYAENNQQKIFQDLISNSLADASVDGGNHLERLDFFIHGLIFSSDRQFASLSVSTSNPGSINNAIKLVNFSTDNEVECDVELRFRRISWISSAGVEGNVQRIRLDQPLVNFNQSFFNEEGFAMLAIRGEVHPISVNTENKPGAYIGDLTISITNL